MYVFMCIHAIMYTCICVSMCLCEYEDVKMKKSCVCVYVIIEGYKPLDKCTYVNISKYMYVEI